MALKNEQEETITSREEKGFLVIIFMKKKTKNHGKLVTEQEFIFNLFFSFFVIEFIFSFEIESGKHFEKRIKNLKEKKAKKLAIFVLDSFRLLFFFFFIRKIQPK